MDQFSHKLIVQEDFDIELFENYIGNDLNFVVNTNYGRSSHVFSIDLIEVKHKGLSIPESNPYHYYKLYGFYIVVLIIFIISVILWFVIKYNVSKRMDLLLLKRTKSFSLINNRFGGFTEIIEDGLTPKDRKTSCFLRKQESCYKYEYEFVYFDEDVESSSWKVKYKVQFYLQSFIMKSIKTNEIVLDLSEKYKDRILDLSDKYRQNELDSNLFHPEDVLPFANQILDEIDEEISLKLSESKI